LGIGWCRVIRVLVRILDQFGLELTTRLVRGIETVPNSLTNMLNSSSEAKKITKNVKID